MSEKKVKKSSAKSPSSENKSKRIAEAQISIAKKKECLTKAVEAVKSLLENPISADFLIQSCQHLNQAYYKDVIEERAIESMCGYSICSNPRPKVPTKQYHISVRYNKVFDITERKYFCSNECFKASKYLENQFPTCPLWLLDDERPSVYKLFSTDETCPDVGEVKLVQSDVWKEELLEFKKEYDAQESKENRESEEKNEERDDEVKGLMCETKKPAVDVKMQSSVVKKRPQKSHVRQVRLTPSEVVENILREWITLNTLKFIFDGERYGEFLADRGFQADTLEGVVGITASKDKQAIADEYSKICRTLATQELDDRAVDYELLNEDRGDGTSLKRQSLAQDTAKFSLNVAAFLQGKTEIAIKEREQLASNAEPANNCEYSVPLVDSHSQRALRRRIIMERIHSASTQILSGVGLTFREIASDLKTLVHSFNLQANTITLKPAELTLLILIILKLLSLKDEKIRNSLLENSSRHFISIVLKAYEKDTSYLEHYCNSLLDVNTCIRNTNMAFGSS